MNEIERVTQPDWKHIFSPSTIAVIGASNTPGSWGNNAVKGLLATGVRRIFPVNPNAAEIMGLKAYPSVTDIPEQVDFAVIVVADRLVPPVLKQCVAKGIKAAIVISAGFAETGEQGKALQSELVEIANGGGMRFIGPNSMGHADTRSKLSTFGQPGEMPIGEVALLSQSGSTCMRIARAMNEAGIALSKYVSTGNEASLRLEDYLEYLAKDDDTWLIACYIEGLRDGRRFFRLSKEVTRHKPVVVVKIGGTGESAKAVASHTGALAGSDQVYTAAFKQSGVIRVEDEEELCDTVFALLNCSLPRGNRVGILSIGGGPGAVTAEACEKDGLEISHLEPETLTKLDKYLPPRWSRRNPVDMAGPSAAELSVIADMLWPLIEDKNTDAVFLLAPIVMDSAYLINRMGLDAEAMKAYREKEERNLKLIRDKMDESGKPVFLLWQSASARTDPVISSLFRNVRIPVYSSPRRAARVMRYLTWYARYLEGTRS